MRSGMVVLLVAVIGSCTGCAKYYYRVGTSFEQAKSDCADCTSELEKRVTNTKPGAYEHEFMEDCMRRQGYELVTEDKLPLGVKRQDPDLSLRGFLYGRRRGLAGTIE
ncbi:MAG: hypothetical protein JSW66_03235 [Phycisphaerales bacterium]|nr:MAG: hypothetical protein JSW66_03235 [Phycisphaerales bacterium]